MTLCGHFDPVGGVADQESVAAMALRLHTVVALAMESAEELAALAVPRGVAPVAATAVVLEVPVAAE